MKKHITYILITLLICTSCYDKCDFSLPKEYRNLMPNYSQGDTLYFISTKNDSLDTLVISKIDSIQTCGQGFMIWKSASWSYEIKHLPSNRWIYATEGFGKNQKNIDQNLITICKNFDENSNPSYSILFDFREFSGTVDSIPVYVKDSTYLYIDVNSFLKIPIEDWLSKKYEEPFIKEIHWAKEVGFVGYEYSNGEHYKLIKSL